MSKVPQRRRAVVRRRRFVLFASGAALGSAIGLVIGSALTFWLGEGTARALLRQVRGLGGDDSPPHFDLLAQ